MMNTHIALCLILFFCVFHPYANALTIKTDLWLSHKQKYGLTFNEKEDQLRRKIFEENLQYINVINAKNLTYKLEMNHLGHLATNEIVKGYNAKARKNTNYHIKTLNKLDKIEIADEVDWRQVGAVSAVKDQGHCGSCWSFSTTGVVESHYKLKYGHMKLFSEKQLVDCDRRTVDKGCDGGLPDEALEYIREFGIVTEEEYPYKPMDGTCIIDPTFIKSHNFTKIKGYTMLGATDEDLTHALYSKGPVSVAIDASQKDFHFYKSGVYENPDCVRNADDLDHAVLAVGYGHDSKVKKDFYIVKNSWSERWGEQGYIRMARNVENTCGITLDAIIPFF